MKTQHTPKPWTRKGTHIYYQRNPGGYRFDVAEVFRDVGVEAAEANARLIAAAPDLLKALKAVAQHVDLSQYYVLPLDKMVNEAIAKAEGKE